MRYLSLRIKFMDDLFLTTLDGMQIKMDSMDQRKIINRFLFLLMMVPLIGIQGLHALLAAVVNKM